MKIEMCTATYIQYTYLSVTKGENKDLYFYLLTFA